MKANIKDFIVTMDRKQLLTLELADDFRLMYDELKDCELDFECRRYRKKRSLNANAYFHVLVNKIAEKLNIGNEECKKNLVLEYGTVAESDEGEKYGIMLPRWVDVNSVYKYAKWFDRRRVGENEFDCYMIYKQTHTLNSAEMARLIDGTVSEAGQLGIETETPEQIARMVSLWTTE